MVILDFLLENANDDFAQDGFAFVDGQSAVVLQKIGELELGHGQDVRVQRTVN